MEQLIGSTFANNWEIQQRLTSAEYRDVYVQQTGDTSKQIKNAHYLCHNNTCGITTYIERTTLLRNLDKPCLSKCKGCINGSKKDSCWYSTMCREKNLYKTPDRKPVAQAGETKGLFYIKEILPSANYTDHQCRALVKCTVCGAEQDVRLDKVVNFEATCECFRNHSSGEKIVKTWLDRHGIKYQTEKTFFDLVGKSGCPYRYDFAIYDKDNKMRGLIEFDGEQHFKTGSLFNPDGEVQEHDQIKNEYAERRKIPLLRIPYTDVIKHDELLTNFLKSI